MIRAATEQDFEAVHAIYMSENINPYIYPKIMNKDDFKDVFKEMRERDYFWILEHEGQATGTCSAILGTARTSHVATLSSLAIKQEHQGKGLGRGFMAKILDALKAKGLKRIELTVDEDNPRAIAFYKTLGFQIDGKLPRYIKRIDSDEYIDEILMSQIF